MKRKEFPGLDKQGSCRRFPRLKKRKVFGWQVLAPSDLIDLRAKFKLARRYFAKKTSLLQQRSDGRSPLSPVTNSPATNARAGDGLLARCLLLSCREVRSRLCFKDGLVLLLSHAFGPAVRTPQMPLCTLKLSVRQLTQARAMTRLSCNDDRGG